MLHRVIGEGVFQRLGRIIHSAACCHPEADDRAACSLVRVAVSWVPLASIFLGGASTSGTVISAIGRLPKAGLTRRNCERRRFTVLAAMPSRIFLARYSSATASNVAVSDMAFVIFSSLRCWPGSAPDTYNARASSRFLRASARPTVGYAQKANFFCLPCESR